MNKNNHNSCHSLPTADNPAFVPDDQPSKPTTDSKPSNSASTKSSATPNGAHVVELRELQKAQEAGEYDPYLYRTVQHPTTNTETLLHLLKGSLGTGILSMPLAFYHAGYVVGLIATIFIGFLCSYLIHMLLTSVHELCKRRKVPSLTFPATAEAALQEGPAFLHGCAPYAVNIVNIFLLIYQLGICCVYTVFIAENIKDFADQYIEEIDLKFYMLASLLPLVLINYIKNLKFLAPLSTFANFITVGSFAIILYYLIKADMTFESRQPIGPIADFPLFFGTVLFALEAIGVILPLENEMKTPRAFVRPCGVLNIGMVSIVSLYAGMGLLGYLAYGSDVRETITLNIGKEETLAQMAKLLLALAIFITHPLQMYVAVDITWNQYVGHFFEKNKHKQFWDYAVRSGLVLLTFALAVAVPRLDLFISLFGAFCLSTLGLAFPAIIDMCTFWHNRQGTTRTLLVIRNLCFVLFGVAGFIIGTYTSMQKIVESFE